MLVISRKKIAKEVARNWKEQYCKKENKWIQLNDGRDSEEIYNSLVKLGANPDPDKVDKVIGRSGWTSLVCVDCMKYRDRGILFGHGEHSAIVCMECLKGLLFKLFK